MSVKHNNFCIRDHGRNLLIQSKTQDCSHCIAVLIIQSKMQHSLQVELSCPFLTLTVQQNKLQYNT